MSSKKGSKGKSQQSSTWDQLLQPKEQKPKSCIEDLLKKLPPSYPVGAIFLNGLLVPVAAISNVCDCCAYFIGEDGQVVVVDAGKVEGLSFGEAEAEEEEEEEENGGC
ncbi:hypothetical protein KDJ21_024005 [Metabacillus litoralis]|uniref:hypothetical protein n=1 Tax=Metabacillus litoralis TaxID=152268 RepID=UPI001B99D8D3|nr:hypothetical protein [Metabacillus litoralis]UHA59766.1 hypothetical protein KDJ21_024005 [Metabacillus litoralis]